MAISPKPFDVVLYHGNCYDGITAAWVAKMHSPNAELIPVSYGSPPPDEIEGKRVLIVDFSYPRETLRNIEPVVESMLILDHHATAMANLDGLDYAVFDMESSGAGMAWEHLFPGQNSPSVVDYVEDRDLWRFNLHRSHDHHAYMSSLPMTVESVQAIHQMPLDQRLELGKPVREFHELTCRKIAKRARRITIEGQDFWICNVPVEFGSEVAEVLYNRHPSLPVICSSWGSTKGDYYCSCRSRKLDGIDIGAFAKSMGGGGHRHAAGFRTRVPPPYLGAAYDKQERWEG